MNIYSRKILWKRLLFLLAVVIVGVSLWYTNILVKKIANEERNKVNLWAEAIKRRAALIKYTADLFEKLSAEEFKRMELWAEATRRLSIAENDFDFYLKIVSSNTTIPVILTNDKGEINTWLNIEGIKHDNPSQLNSEEREILKKELEEMKKQHEPIVIPYYKDKKNYLYYKDSKLFTDLKVVMDDIIKSFISEIVLNSATVPVLFTDESKQKVLDFGNLDETKIKDSVYVRTTIEKMALQNNPIEIDLGNGQKNYIFYYNSYLLTQLKYYPYVQFFIIGLFLLIAYILFSTSRKAEQNQVWVGMAKETAHQLGTPLSSLIAWMELLELKNVDPILIDEMKKDVSRLETITERFSKIGSVPTLEKVNIYSVINKTVNYLQARVTSKVKFVVVPGNANETLVPLNVSLFEWVIENLCKNAVDAMDGEGTIQIQITDLTQYVYIDVSDTGKGIPRSKFKTVFQPGYTTKQRGWGLGLSLVKRIIEDYHKGKIFVKRSEIGKGTTFRIVINKY
ncbi:MAG: sensor histidine kinase [Bacteroidia bacterium]